MDDLHAKQWWNVIFKIAKECEYFKLDKVNGLCETSMAEFPNKNCTFSYYKM